VLTLIENGELYAPEFIGNKSLLLCGGTILKIGAIDRQALDQTGIEVDVIEASGCVVTPGFIDPHEHLLGGSGESGFASQTPEITASEIALGGITTVVGCLGADTTTKTLPGLLAKVKGLREEGINAYMWTGGYEVPPVSITDSIGSDIMFIDEVTGVGEIAISDERSSDPRPHELARTAHEAHVAATLSNKSGLLHIHVGEGENRLQILREVINDHSVPAEWLYATHISRSDKLMLEAIELAKDGCFVDVDTVDENLPECLQFYLDNSGWVEKLTVSSDASITSPQNILNQIRRCVLEHGFALPMVLRLVTLNTARALKLGHKGALDVGMAADILVMNKEDLELKEVISGGRRLIRGGKQDFTEKFLEDSNRSVVLQGQKRTGPASEGPLSSIKHSDKQLEARWGK
jgi:beta-aspartyl-dipeptidase (metallo-type)